MADKCWLNCLFEVTKTPRISFRFIIIIIIKKLLIILINCNIPLSFIQVYDELVDYLNEDEHIEIMAEELKSRNVQCTNFYDICLDYILIDSFEVNFVQTLVHRHNCTPIQCLRGQNFAKNTDKLIRVEIMKWARLAAIFSSQIPSGFHIFFSSFIIYIFLT